jgi:hypothetical protein
VTADAVLIAVGRVPVTDDLDLAAAAVEVDERGFIVVDDRLRTSASGIFAVGDVNGGPQFTYISLDDFRVVLSQLAGDGARTTADRVAVPNTVFLTPPLARVGMSERDARESGRRVLVAAKNVRDIAAMPRPKIVGDTHGLIKVIVDADTDLVLGRRSSRSTRWRSSICSLSPCAPGSQRASCATASGRTLRAPRRSTRFSGSCVRSRDADSRIGPSRRDGGRRVGHGPIWAIGRGGPSGA